MKKVTAYHMVYIGSY